MQRTPSDVRRVSTATAVSLSKVRPASFSTQRRPPLQGGAVKVPEGSHPRRDNSTDQGKGFYPSIENVGTGEAKNSGKGPTRRSRFRRASLKTAIGKGITTVRSALSTALTHDVIDPYCTVRLATSEVTHTTKPVKDGGSNVTWTKEHLNELRFEYPFVKREMDVDAMSLVALADEIEGIETRNEREQRFPLPGFFDIDVFDQDLMMDAHVGGACIDLEDVFADIAEQQSALGIEFGTRGAQGSLPLGKSLFFPGTRSPSAVVSCAFFLSCACTAGRSLLSSPRTHTHAVEHSREVTLHRRGDHAIAGFIRIRVTFEKRGLKWRADGSSYPSGTLTVIIDDASDLWDPNDQSDWIPDDAHHGTSLVAATLICLAYFGIGAGFFVYVEEWTIIDALYFAAATFTTVGYGDVKPLLDRSVRMCGTPAHPAGSLSCVGVALCSRRTLTLTHTHTTNTYLFVCFLQRENFCLPLHDYRDLDGVRIGHSVVLGPFQCLHRSRFVLP